jgi:DNA-binding FrmR family transcriptional regulator
MHMPTADKKKLLTRLRRAEGQLAAVRRMVDEDADCVATLTQIAAVRGALARAGDLVLRNHIDTCVAQAIQGGDSDAQSERLDELMDTLARYSSRS